MHDHYILDANGDPVPESDMLVWGQAMSVDRTIAYDEALGHRVSTVFLGINHQFGNGPPILYETMVFTMDSYADLFCDRYTTRDEALAGHQRVLERLPEILAERANDDER